MARVVCLMRNSRVSPSSWERVCRRDGCGIPSAESSLLPHLFLLFRVAGADSVMFGVAGRRGGVTVAARDVAMRGGGLRILEEGPASGCVSFLFCIELAAEPIAAR